MKHDYKQIEVEFKRTDLDDKIDQEIHNWLVEFGTLLTREQATGLVKQKEEECQSTETASTTMAS